MFICAQKTAKDDILIQEKKSRITFPNCTEKKKEWWATQYKCWKNMDTLN